MNIIAEEVAQFPKETFDALDVYKLERVRSHLIDVMIKYKGDDAYLESLLSDALISCAHLRVAIEGSLDVNYHKEDVA